jgi:hypothetical protein
MKCALATLAVGRQFTNPFHHQFRPGWDAYCRRHGHGLVVLDRLPDTSERALARSPAWQKCIVHRCLELRDFDRIAWVDADIFISPDAPDVFACVPPDKIGAVDDHATPSAEEHRLVTERAYALWTSQGIPFHRTDSAADWYRARRIDCDFKEVVQTGMFVFSPSLHGPLLEHVYESYENLGDNALNHEMAPLSHEMIRSGAMHWLSPKFNMMWICYELLHYPFLSRPEMIPGRLPMFAKRKIAEYLRQPCAQTALRNNHFLHFSGGSKFYKFLG